MDPIPTRWDTFVEEISRPHRVLQGFFEYISAWTFTRRWSSLLALLPLIIVVGAGVGLVIAGSVRDQGQLGEEYFEWAIAEIEVDEIEAEEDGHNDTSVDSDEKDKRVEWLEEEKVSPFGELLLRRVLQLQDSNDRAAYLVAAHLARNGRFGQAHSMMRRIAPELKRGYPPAHAWLAFDQIRNGVQTAEERKSLMFDLQLAQSWPGIGEALTGIHADLLEQEGKVGDALTLLTKASVGSEALQMKLAKLAYKHGYTKSLQQVSETQKQRIEKAVRAGDAKIEDYVMLANLRLLESEPAKARIAAEAGLRLEPANASLKRLMSEAYRLEYSQTAKFSDQGVSFNLGLLDAALKSDPSNPAIAQEVARLIVFGQTASTELRQALEQQLATGTATAVTHILLAIRSLQDDELLDAIPHLEIALRQAPGNPIAQNNLALSLARALPERMPEALELINEAVANAPSNAEYLDTQGQIRALAGDHVGAIDSYEKAIGINATRLSTRRKLLAEYQAVGMTEIAALQQKIIAKAEEANNSPDEL